MIAFNRRRWLGMAKKEFIQIWRDRPTFAMIFVLPILQIMLYGFAINMDPKHLPTILVASNHSPYVSSIVRAIENTGYFRIVDESATPFDADAALQSGRVQFAITIPDDFSRRLVRGERPAILVEVDATDPSSTSNALASLNGIVQRSLSHDLVGPLVALAPQPEPFEFRIQRRYNPEGITQYNIVPGLMGVIVSMTMVLMTSLALTRERERGTLENLLATPANPLEVISGKMVPYVFIGLLQVSLILLTARFVFGIPLFGSLVELYLCVLLYIGANLFIGLAFSTIAKTQLQAMQLSFFYFLASILLSGFMFPFRGMTEWAQWIGNVLPLTHFLNIVRGIMLKGVEVESLWVDLASIGAFAFGSALFALFKYKRTLD
jgi:ABC-2 type transport system permease protein